MTLTLDAVHFDLLPWLGGHAVARGDHASWTEGLEGGDEFWAFRVTGYPVGSQFDGHHTRPGAAQTQRRYLQHTGQSQLYSRAVVLNRWVGTPRGVAT